MTMRVQIGLSLAGLVFATLPHARGQGMPSGRFAIVDVKLFHGETVREHQTVLVGGGKIVSVTARGRRRASMERWNPWSAGLTPVEAMKASTSNPAKAFRLTDRGRIAPGLRADLLLVEGDPSVKIEDTRKIVGVWKMGVADDRATYAASIAEEKKAADLAKASAPVLGSFSDFDDGTLKTAFGEGWSESTDSIAGGKSTVKFEVVPGGAEKSAKSLSVTGTIAEGTPYPWAGVMFARGAAVFAPANLSGRTALEFWATAKPTG